MPGGELKINTARVIERNAELELELGIVLTETKCININYLKNKKRISLRNKIYRQVHPEIFRNRSQQHAHLLNRYKISLADYNIMLTEQDGVCAICHKGPESQKGRNLSIDHNHLIKRVRGLLCRKCNSVLAMADDSIEMLDAAKQYLIKTSTKGRS